MKIRYPEDFASTVKVEFRGQEDVVRMLERGDCLLGRVLAEEAAKRVEPRDVISAFDEGRQDSILAAARAALRRAALYRSWVRIAMDSIQSEEDGAGGARGTRTA